MLVEVIMAVFIANFKVSEHPIINIIVRGLLVAVIGSFIALFSSILEGWDFSIGFALIFSLIIGLAVSIFLFAVEAFLTILIRNDFIY